MSSVVLNYKNNVIGVKLITRGKIFLEVSLCRDVLIYKRKVKDNKNS